MRKVYFENLSVGAEFKSGGSNWVKCSLSVAAKIWPSKYDGKRFKFNSSQVVEVAK